MRMSAADWERDLLNATENNKNGLRLLALVGRPELSLHVLLC